MLNLDIGRLLWQGLCAMVHGFKHPPKKIATNDNQHGGNGGRVHTGSIPIEQRQEDDDV